MAYHSVVFCFAGRDWRWKTKDPKLTVPGISILLLEVRTYPTPCPFPPSVHNTNVSTSQITPSLCPRNERDGKYTTSEFWQYPYPDLQPSCPSEMSQLSNGHALWCAARFYLAYLV